MSYEEISKVLNVTKSQVQYVLNQKHVINKCKRGPKPKIGKKEKLQIKRSINRILKEGKKVNSSKILAECELNVSKWTVQRSLKKMDLKYKKASIQIKLTQQHRQLRLKCVSEWIEKRINWTKVVFTDEKRFSLDGNDCWMSYQSNDLKTYRNKRQMKGGSIMVWGMLFSSGKLLIKLLKGNQKSSDYKETIETFAVPAIMNEMGDDFILQQDNCSIHVSKVMKEFYSDNGLTVLTWPSRSPDLNIIENVWKMLSDLVYDGPQFLKYIDLSQKINDSVRLINEAKKQNIISLFDKYTNRLCDVLKCNGGLTKH